MALLFSIWFMYSQVSDPGPSWPSCFVYFNPNNLFNSEHEIQIVTKTSFFTFLTLFRHKNNCRYSTLRVDSKIHTLHRVFTLRGIPTVAHGGPKSTVDSSGQVQRSLPRMYTVDAVDRHGGHTVDTKLSTVDTLWKHRGLRGNRGGKKRGIVFKLCQK